MKKKSTAKEKNPTMFLLNIWSVWSVCLLVVTHVTNSELAMGALLGIGASAIVMAIYTK
jgi:hypothetical protein